jgi:hypothetical protein
MDLQSQVGTFVERLLSTLLSSVLYIECGFCLGRGDFRCSDSYFLCITNGSVSRFCMRACGLYLHAIHRSCPGSAGARATFGPDTLHAGMSESDSSRSASPNPVVSTKRLVLKKDRRVIRKLTTIKTKHWHAPMRKKKPDGYGLMIKRAPPTPITTDDLISFVSQKPGIDKADWNNSSRWWFNKFAKNATKVKPEHLPLGFEPSAPFSSFAAFVRASPRWEDRIQTDGGDTPIALNTDLYSLWDAVDEWTKYRQAATGKTLDNGWCVRGWRACVTRNTCTKIPSYKNTR